MSNPSNPAHEPTMEEILASIRKIISEDQPEAVQAPAAVEAPQAYEPEPQQFQAHDDGVLDLTDEVHEDHGHAPEPAPAPVMHRDDPADDIAFATIDEPVAPKQEAPAMDHEDVISESTRGAVGRALNPLDSRPSTRAASSGGTLDALFTQAVQEAMGPVLHDWVKDNSADVITQLKPIIREWMDHNLPDLIENAVKREISRRGR